MSETRTCDWCGKTEKRDGVGWWHAWSLGLVKHQAIDACCREHLIHALIGKGEIKLWGAPEAGSTTPPSGQL